MNISFTAGQWRKDLDRITQYEFSHQLDKTVGSSVSLQSVGNQSTLSGTSPDGSFTCSSTRQTNSDTALHASLRGSNSSVLADLPVSTSGHPSSRRHTSDPYKAKHFQSLSISASPLTQNQFHDSSSVQVDSISNSRRSSYHPADRSSSCEFIINTSA